MYEYVPIPMGYDIPRHIIRIKSSVSEISIGIPT